MACTATACSCKRSKGRGEQQRHWMAPDGGHTHAPYPSARAAAVSVGLGWTASTRASDIWRAVHEGARAPAPPLYGSGRPAFSPPTVLRGRGRIFPAPARGNPAPHGWRAISVPLAAVASGSLRSLPDTSFRRSSCIEAQTVQLPKLTVEVR